MPFMVQGTRRALKMGIRNPLEIKFNRSLDLEVSFLVVPQDAKSGGSSLTK